MRTSDKARGAKNTVLQMNLAEGMLCVILANCSHRKVIANPKGRHASKPTGDSRKSVSGQTEVSLRNGKIKQDKSTDISGQGGQVPAMRGITARGPGPSPAPVEQL